MVAPKDPMMKNMEQTIGTRQNQVRSCCGSFDVVVDGTSWATI
jgi:hypothetical protein